MSDSFRLVFIYGQWQLYRKPAYSDYWNPERTFATFEDGIRHIYYSTNRPVAVPLVIEHF